MAIETKDKLLGENLYQIILPPPTACLPICNRAATLLAPVLSSGLGAAVNGIELAGTVAEKLKQLLGPALLNMTSALSKTDPVALNELMLDAIKASHLCCNTKPVFNQIDFDRHFGENRGDCYQIMTWVLWECVKDFFPKLEGSPLQGIKETALQAFLSRTGGQTTGGSGDLAGASSAPTEN